MLWWIWPLAHPFIDRDSWTRDTDANHALRSVDCPLLGLVASLLALPIRAEGTVSAHREILPFLVWTSYVAVSHHNALDVVFGKECLHFPLDLGIALEIRAHPAVQDRPRKAGSRWQSDSYRRARPRN